MSNGVTAAVIAAVVSVVVAAGSVTVMYLTTRASLRRDHERQEAEFRRMMTERLYDRCVAVYPGLFKATEAFRNSHLSRADDLRSHLATALAQVDEWHAQGGGLLLSSVHTGTCLSCEPLCANASAVNLNRPNNRGMKYGLRAGSARLCKWILVSYTMRIRVSGGVQRSHGSGLVWCGACQGPPCGIAPLTIPRSCRAAS
jgi:hypothetical protein